MDVMTFIQATINGLFTGGMYALLALGLTFVFGIMRIINFSHGELVMVGSYMTYFLFRTFRLDPFVSLLITIPVSGLLGYVIQRCFVSRILNAPHLNQILLTLGLSIIMTNGALMGFSGNFYTIATGYSSQSIRVGDVSFGYMRFIAFVIGLSLTGALYLMLKRTMVGKKLRAVSQNLEGAKVVGINVDGIYVFAFVTSSILAAIAGTLSVMLMYVHPHIGFSFIIKAFAIVILGGLGSIPGALLGALLWGVLESYTATYIVNGSGWADAVAFFVLIAFMVIRPKGIFGIE
jgi:branched-chain amino acid transport system permease protein